ERLTQVADADDRDGLAMGEPEGPLQVAQQGDDLIAHAADAVGTDVGQVLAQLGRVDAAGRRELLTGDRVGTLFGELAEDPQVEGETSDRGIRNGPRPHSRG